MKYLLTRLPALLLALVVGLIVSSSAFGQVTIVIENGDGPGVGFNDPGPPVAGATGNSGATLGAQRMIALQEAARIWGSSLSSTPTITIHATWEALTSTCTANSGTLASAGNNGDIFANFSGAVSGFWYGNALANALSGTDRNGAAKAEINARFNVSLGTPGCLQSLHWYYGLDGAEGSGGVDLVAVALHEFAHGLGFQTFTSSSTGAQQGTPPGLPSIYDRFLLDNTAAKTWAQMTTNAERQASAINSNNLVWNGPQVTSDVPGVLSASGTPRLRVNPPSSIAGNYTVGTADFGPPLGLAGVTANVVQAVPNDACSPIGSVAGQIALIDRGTCSFAIKTKTAQNAGAVGVIIVDNVSGSTPPGMTGSDGTITIPTVSITMTNGDAIKAQLGSGVNATLILDTSTRVGADQLNHALMFAPNPVSGGSSVSHWDSSAFPNQLMEPNNSADVTHSVNPPQDLTVSLMKDIGWPTGPPPPPPSPTPTPSPPANDNFANAQVIGGCSGSVTGTNVGATKESGEPNNPASPTSAKSVWYQWQAPSTGSATIDTIGSGYDTILAVYTGTAVNGLTLVGGLNVGFNDDIASGNTASRVVFSATQGTTYRIAVNGFENTSGSGGDTGTITLNWSETSCTFTPLTIITEDQTTNAAAVDSITLQRGPFAILNPNNFNTPGDSHTRVILFTSSLGTATTSNVTVTANGTSLTVENVGTVTGVTGLTASYIIVRLPTGLASGNLPLTVTLFGAASSNHPTLGIQ